MEVEPATPISQREVPTESAGERTLRRYKKDLPQQLSDGLRFLLLEAIRQDTKLMDFRESVHSLFRMAGEKPPTDSAIRSWMTSVKAGAERSRREATAHAGSA